MSVEIESIMEINEGKNSFKMKYLLNLFWIDEEVTYINLNEMKNTTLSEKQIEYLWIPEFEFMNTVDRIHSGFKEASEGIIIRKENAKMEFAPLSEVSNRKSYRGSDG